MIFVFVVIKFVGGVVIVVVDIILINAADPIVVIFINIINIIVANFIIIIVDVVIANDMGLDGSLSISPADIIIFFVANMGVHLIAIAVIVVLIVVGVFVVLHIFIVLNIFIIRIIFIDFVILIVHNVGKIEVVELLSLLLIIML